MPPCPANISRSLTDPERRDLFEAFFLWEQEHIVGPAIEQAFNAFDWPMIRTMALRPKIRFSYFGGRPLHFRNFNDTSERIKNGIAAFDRARAKGWSEVERGLDDYAVMQSAFAADPKEFFLELQRTVHGNARLAPA